MKTSKVKTLKNLGISTIKVIVEGTSSPELIIKYLDDKEENIIGMTNQINKLKNFMKTEKAVKTLCKALRKDPHFFYSYQSNIAMQFKDEYSRIRKEKNYKYLNDADIHIIANEAAKSFLNLLIKE